MTDSKAPSRNSPKRSTPYMNDAANSLYEANPADAYPVIEWIKRTGASVDETLAAWKAGKLAELPVGRAWDVVRIPTFEGWEVVRQLCALRVTLGPVLHTQLGVEVLVPVGSAEDWDCPGSTVLVVGDTIDVPHPAVVPPHTQNARSWISAPRSEPTLTDAADLYGAYLSATATMTRTNRSGR
ncbi:hypothetical protein ACFWVU_01000 [Streptomyces sp. NPDC058686]|uniref:hypothetical protein n=1 Tax=Streptomyces sp. NPDC058686 TaxID=3346599 RepID=UPI0036555E37